jgi:hypothetical protein
MPLQLPVLLPRCEEILVRRPRFANYETKPRTTLFSMDAFSGHSQEKEA